jgi:hypothetical protein
VWELAVPASTSISKKVGKEDEKKIKIELKLC